MQWMKLFLCALFLLSGLSAAKAEEGEADLYRVADVSVDVTAGSGTDARNKAIAEAEKAAFEQLIGRLSSKSGATTPDDATLASLVQAFDVQKETVLPGRYIGILTVQFRPSATRAFLHKKGVDFSEIRSKPIIVLPVVATEDGRATLWTERTPWRTAWEEEARASGIVPLVVPPGELDDIALISDTEALQGKQTALAALAGKYGANGLVVAILNGGTEPAKEGFKVDMRRYDQNGRMQGETEHLSLGSAANDKAVAGLLATGTKHVRTTIDAVWKQQRKKLEGPVTHLRLTVPIPTLAAWSDVKARIERVPDISRTNVTAFTRGAAHIEIEYHGDMESLQTSLKAEGFHLEQQPGPLGGWLLVNS